MMSVSMGPGEIALTVMSYTPSSRAVERVSPITPALATEYGVLEKVPQKIVRAHPSAGESAGRVTRIPPGHVEGYLEGFANLYSDAAEQITARLEGREPDPGALLLPSVEDGARGVRFITAAIESGSRGAVWTDLSLKL